ncbi:hypothetical protein [Halomonas sp. BC04]|uniref:hypothetical protein n=1 Tax=Halomonas sp. BC04 TaxID=1403540 RepID=UPI0003ED744B|nr:hypothetical protein [Halomonas sp. BC04]EWG99214.1 hypothetical protein Q427_26230 [Halomonas sp. BC04]
MADRVLFQMYSGHRAQLIEKHEFYVKQATARLLDQFTDDAISQEADRAAKESLERRGQYFDPDRHDPGDFEEAAYDDGVWRYQLMTELRDRVRLSIVSGFFHEWEKNLRQWLVDEVRHWHHGEVTRGTVWKKNLNDLFDLLESFGWPLKSSPYFKDLDACRLVVNVYKHGDGTSLNELASSYPQFLEHPLAAMRGQVGEMWFSLSHEYLKVSDRNLAAFSSAILMFWKDVPENVFHSQIMEPPSWLVKAIEKDQQKKENSK